MKYTPEEVLLYLKEEDVKFVRMSFCDPFGRQKMWRLWRMSCRGRLNTA